MEQGFTQVEFGTHKVLVPTGGYYDRFRMNPDLDEVARDPAAGNIDFFRRIPKSLVATRVGPAWSPNFYYRTSSVQLLFLAPHARLRAALPVPLEPLRPLPGHGLVALTFFSYHVCDNDPYNEVSIAIVIRRPGARGAHSLELARMLRRRAYVAHVLALPVDTEIARMRGVHGYQLPKWLADIDLDIGSEVRAQIRARDGTPDLSLEAPLPGMRTVAPQSRLGTNTMVHLLDGKWHQTTVQSNTLAFARQMLPKDVTLSRRGGPMSRLLDGLGARLLVHMDVTQDAQLVLNMPRPLNTLAPT
ncbi:MAG TPA: acetoacetate decarboxylase [Xanthomonadaceae bacterium]|nr:acetoacetate decarboxylase [Xanthomonadaceae bacterium]